MKRAITWSAVSTAAQANEDERYSLPAQIEDNRKAAAALGCIVVDELIVEGRTRNYLSIEEAVASGDTAFIRLQRHLDAKDFDVFICRDAHRFGRTASLVHQITATVYERCHAAIYSTFDGRLIPYEEYPMWATLKGFQTAHEQKTRKQHIKRGMEKRVERGVTPQSQLPMSHKIVRDEMGKAVKVVVDEANRGILLDAAAVLLDGVSWQALERELFKRYGHGDGGKPYARYRFYMLFYNPLFWGHTARYWFAKHNLGTWSFDDTEAAPDGVLLNRNTHEPMFSGELAERVKAELRYRKTLGGRQKPTRSHKFTGLLLCAACGHTLRHNGKVYEKDKKGRYKLPAYLCSSRREYGTGCDNKSFMSEKRVQRYVHDLLTIALEADDPAAMFPQEDAPNTAEEKARLDGELRKALASARQLIAKQATAPSEFNDLYDEQIRALGEVVDGLKRRISHLDYEENRRLPREAHAAFEELKTLTLPDFWQQSDEQINRLLYRLFGNRRLLVFNNHIKDITLI